MQERISSEKQRLASVRVRETSDVARAAETLSGQAVSSAPTLEELLRRPHVHYRRAAAAMGFRVRVCVTQLKPLPYYKPRGSRGCARMSDAYI